ncbi:MAG: hypothetical protein KME08_20370 [Aphanothece sp. CMT-3BRIN-NPC111]|jgi:hypothetical protein|nr:hypothetical protein [Aphanothece sp. CMT-3BRIN-NPC111]
MNTPKPSNPPAENPDFASSQFSPTSPYPSGFPAATSPEGDIGERVAIERALLMAPTYGESTPTVISANLMTYKEAMQLGPEPLSVSEEHPRSNIPVRLVILTGAFKGRSRPRGVTNTPTFTKAHIILRAADGLMLGECLCLE